MLSNHNLKKASIDRDGLGILKKMLMQEGFKESDINRLLADLLDDQEKGNISLEDLFDKLFDLQVENTSFKEDSSENYLEVSTIPFLESLMNSLTIPKQRISEILTHAEISGKGLDLDFIIEKLQDLQKESFYKGNKYRTPENDENFKLLLEQMGFEKNASARSSLHLSDLVGFLETLRSKISQPQDKLMGFDSDDQKSVTNEKSLALLEALFKGLKFKNQESRFQVFEFSESQIKNQFKNQLLIPGKEIVGNRGFFMSGQSKNSESKLSVLGKTAEGKIGTSIKNEFKGVEFLLNERGNTAIGAKNQTLNTREFLKQMESERNRVLDKNQFLTLDAKTNDTQSSLNILKTKPSLKNLPNFVSQQVSKSLVRAINQGENTLRIQLKPPELGRLLISIDNTGSHIKINVITENSAAREVLASSVNDLRTVLSNSGVNLERFEVYMSSDFRQSMADAKNQAGDFNRRNKNREKFLSNSVNPEILNISTGFIEASEQKGSVHLVA